MSTTSINVMHPCPCCGHLVFVEPPGSHGICPICSWEDDESQLRFPTMCGGTNRPSLMEAQKNFAEFGASESRLLDRVRKPQPHERREPGWRSVNPMKDLITTPLGAVLITCRDNYPANRTLLYYWRAIESP